MPQYRMVALMALISLTTIQTVSGIQPDKGDKLPPFAKTFPGCSCKWTEPGWSCAGSVAYPKAMVGESCCCCTLECHKDSRCTNEQCLTIGVDQKKEIDAAAARLKAILGDADVAIGELPAYKVKLSYKPTGKTITAACKAKGMFPLCDAATYCGSPGTSDCYHPDCQARSTGQWEKAVLPKISSFSTPQYMLKTDIEPTQFYCAGMYGSYYHGARADQPHGGALTANAMNHMWIKSVTGNTRIVISDMKTGKQKELRNCDTHGWHTYCVKNAPW